MTETQRQAINTLLQNPTPDSLWQAILAFESYPFTTTSNLPFTYSIKVNRRGLPGNEIIVSLKEKSITWSSVEKALDVVIEKSGGEFPVKMSTPKELNIFGASYIYPVFIRLGLIEHVGSNKRGGPRKGSKRKHKDERECSVGNNGGELDKE